MTIKINGGIVASQALTGSLKYFKMTGNFNYTVSDGTVTLAGAVSGGTSTTTYPLVGLGDPVPNSLAALALNAITERCTIVEIGLIGTPAATTEIHFAAENTSFGWIDENGDVDTAAMVAAVAAVAVPDTGTTVVVPTTSGGTVGENTSAPATATVSTTVTITQVPFALA